MDLACDRCREQLLDSLYGLLDPAEDAALAVHLAHCPACAAAKADAAAMQGLFATAAKVPFPDVTFSIPVEAEPAVPAARPSRVPAWAVAAGLLVASLAMLAPAIRDYSAHRGHATAQAMAAKRLAELEAADADRVARQANLIAKLDRDLADARESHKQRIRTWVNAEVASAARPFKLEISGPVAALPGAPNEYVVVTTADGKPLATTIAATVRDPRGTVYHAETLKPGESKIRLPAGLWAKFPAGADDLALTVTATSAAGAKAELAEPIQLLAPVLTTLVVTDKPLYRPGERVFFRSLTLNRTNLQPPARDLTIRFELRKPDGAPLDGATVTGTTQPVVNRDGLDMPVVGPDGQPVRGIACGVLGLPETLPGGEYTLVAFELPPGWASPEPPKGSMPIGTRRFTVAKYRPDTLTKTLEFDARTYGPGDAVKAKLTVKNQNRPLANIGILVAAVHGNNVKIPLKQPGQLKADGTAEIAFTLPNVPDLKAPTLTVTILDENNETIVRRVPLASKTLSLEFFPEGGDLIEGLPNRVYFRATTATGSPADVAGILTDGTKTVCDVKTLTDAEHPGANQGLGVFSFTPEPGKRYAFKLHRPIGTVEPPIKAKELEALGTGYLLPKAETNGVVLAIPSGVIDANQPLQGSVSARTKRDVIVGVYTRGLVVGHARLAIEPGKPAEFAIAPPAVAIGGVTRVTVFEVPAGDAGRADLVPLAERLVFRRPTETLKIAYSADKARYAPGDRVTLTVTATDEKNRPTAAVLMAAVVNQSVLAMADDKAERLLPTHFLLSGELQNPEQLEHADFALTNHPKAAETLDLILGTQGWRRFAEVNGEFRSSTVSDAQKQRFWIANGRLDAMTESARPDRATATQLAATGTLDATIERLEGEKRAAEVVRDRKSPEWNRVSDTLRRTAGEEVESLRKATFNGVVGLLGIVVLATLVFIARASRTKPVIVALLGASVALLAIGYLVKDQLKMAAELPDGAPLAKATVDRQVSTGTDVRETPNVGPAPRIAVAEAPPRADIGPATPARPVPAAKTKLLTDRADRAVRAVADSSPNGAEMAAIDRIKKSLARHAPYVVREYAHLPIRPDPLDATRRDFTETVLWHPVLVLPGDGPRSLNFHVSDATNAYRVLIAGHTLDGRVGATADQLEVRKPLEIDVQLPSELSLSDRPLIPLVATNNTGRSYEAPAEYWSDFLASEVETRALRLGPNRGQRRFVPAKPLATGPARVRVTVAGGGHTDAVERVVSIVPDGFPLAGAANLELAGAAQTTVDIPDRLVPGTLSVKLQVFANSLADIQSGLDGILREPHGCFEQTSSANYPNVLALEYLKDANRWNGGAADQARGLLERGLGRLASFEVQPPTGARAGFEWFGHHPAHECLTAYGLVQLADMARLVPVDPALVERTKTFLLNRRDGAGGFTRKKDAHSFGSVPDAVVNAYILWALRTADPKADLAREAKAVAAEALASGDPYRLALAANAAPAPELLKALAAKQSPDGSFPGAETSITRSRGRDLVVETTGLAALAFLAAKDAAHAGPLANAIAFLVKSREPHGAFGGTQATVLALKAIVAHNRAHRRPPEAGEIVVRVDGKEVARLPFDNADLRPIVLEFDDPRTLFTPGRHAIALETTAKQTYPVAVSWSAYCSKPASAADAPLAFAASLAEASVTEGRTVRLNVKLENRDARDTGMAVAIVGLPAGLTLPPDFGQLKALTAKPATGAPALDHWEWKGRELALYWRGLGPKQAVELSLDLIAATPGEFRGPASRAYLYYGAESKVWLDPLGIRVRPRE
jgi:alpha-2-macroglobulin-like protein